MSRRIVFIIVGIVVISVGAFFVVRHIQEERERMRDAMRQALDIASKQVGKTLSHRMANMSSPKLNWQAKLEGDVTAITFTVSNRSSNSYKDITLDGFRLANAEPNEKATLPVKIAGLAPGESRQFVLRYDHLEWLGDDIPANRLDMNWAQKPLDFSNAWVTIWDSSPASDPSVTVEKSESKGSIDSTGVPICLDENDARMLKSRRDAAWKTKDKEKDSRPKQPSSRP